MATDRFAEDVEAVRSGTILAHDANAYTRWRSDVNRRSGRKVGRNLAQLAHDFGGQVIVGGFEFRES